MRVWIAVSWPFILPFDDCVTSSNSAHSTAKVLRSTEYVHRLSVWSVKWRLRQCVVLLILAQVLRSKFLQFLLFCPSNVYAPGLDSLFVLQCNFRKREMPNRWILFLYWQAFQIRSFYLLFGKLVQCFLLTSFFWFNFNRLFYSILKALRYIRSFQTYSINIMKIVILYSSIVCLFLNMVSEP